MKFSPIMLLAVAMLVTAGCAEEKPATSPTVILGSWADALGRTWDLSDVQITGAGRVGSITIELNEDETGDGNDDACEYSFYSEYGTTLTSAQGLMVGSSHMCTEAGGVMGSDGICRNGIVVLDVTNCSDLNGDWEFTGESDTVIACRGSDCITLNPVAGSSLP